MSMLLPITSVRESTLLNSNAYSCFASPMYFSMERISLLVSLSCCWVLPSFLLLREKLEPVFWKPT